MAETGLRRGTLATLTTIAVSCSIIVMAIQSGSDLRLFRNAGETERAFALESSIGSD